MTAGQRPGTPQSGRSEATAGPFHFARQVAEIDEWLDAEPSKTYRKQPVAQHWARVAKASEEVGEAIEKLIAWTGQNPRKPQRDEAYGEMLDELADVALTGILAIQHFTKDVGMTQAYLTHRLARLHARMEDVRRAA